MEVINREYKLCLACMEVHCVKTVEISESVMFYGEEVVLRSVHEYCSVAGGLLETEDMTKRNKMTLDSTIENVTVNHDKVLEREGDRKTIMHRGIRGLILRATPDQLGHLCGYMETVDTAPTNHCYLMDIEVHGGITHSGKLPGEEGHWIGFDCSHPGDILPAWDRKTKDFFGGHGYTYKDMDYVENEVRKMIDQVLDKT